MSAKKQEPKILGITESQPEGFKWVRLKKIDWEDETGKKVCLDFSRTSLPGIVAEPSSISLLTASVGSC